jgi:hypothetical protein
MSPSEDGYRVSVIVLMSILAGIGAGLWANDVGAALFAVAVYFGVCATADEFMRLPR